MDLKIFMSIILLCPNDIVLGKHIESPRESAVDRNASDPIVCITNGCLQGTTMNGYQSGLFEAFLGIPFAQPPIKQLRFANPVPASDWSGLLDATKAKPECIQKNYLLINPNVTGVEDCLYLNVYRPLNLNANSSLPVMVFIHGGAYFAGIPSPEVHGPQYFMDNKEVILVIMAYRLGVMGFLSTGDDLSPGNYGLKDQTMALKWVKDNIEQFGGDQNLITLFGVSAGASSVHMHMMSPLSAGLFARAIVMSGNAIAPYNDPEPNPLQQVKKQAKLVGISVDSENVKDLIEKLRKVDADKLVQSGDGLKYWSVDPLTYYRPVIEQNRNGAFLTQHPKLLSLSGYHNSVPWMTGFVQNEGAVRAIAIVSNKTLLNDLNRQFDYLLPKLMEIDQIKSLDIPNVVKKIKNFYLNGGNNVTEENFQGFMNLYSDRAFLYPLYKSVENYLEYGNIEQNPVFLYKFLFNGPISYSVAFSGQQKKYGVVHLDDTIYLFRSDYFPEFPKTSIYAEMIKSLVDFYVHFAKYGKPSELTPRPVKPCSKGHEGAVCEYYEIVNSPNNNSKQFEIRPNNKFDMKMIKFWDDIFS